MGKFLDRLTRKKPIEPEPILSVFRTDAETPGDVLADAIKQTEARIVLDNEKSKPRYQFSYFIPINIQAGNGVRDAEIAAYKVYKKIEKAGFVKEMNRQAEKLLLDGGRTPVTDYDETIHPSINIFQSIRDGDSENIVFVRFSTPVLTETDKKEWEQKTRAANLQIAWQFLVKFKDSIKVDWVALENSSKITDTIDQLLNNNYRFWDFRPKDQVGSK